MIAHALSAAAGVERAVPGRSRPLQLCDNGKESHPDLCHHRGAIGLVLNFGKAPEQVTCGAPSGSAGGSEIKLFENPR
jgi:hypothetical protein